MEDYFDIFRMNMKYYREQRNMNQSELAIQANSSNGMIGNIESGRAKPSFDNIIKIAAALEVHPADLFLRNASTTVNNTKNLLRTKLMPQIESFIEKEL
ncbi:MAG: helix-turn-helix transcriptional regulator [Spirochaetaceae bacterium]|nr:helix-turn-helix transcriptional regulator [Spirochaetaceae bacterium]